MEVPAPSAGVMGEILVAKEGDTVEVGALLGHRLAEGDGAAPAAEAPAAKAGKTPAEAKAEAAAGKRNRTASSLRSPAAPSAAKMLV